jgi:YidC/Oxa1 family membrane protein insertase
LVKKGKLAASEAASQKLELDTKVLEGAVVVTDALLRAGEQTQSFDKYQAGYQLISTYQSKYSDNEIWSHPFAVEDQKGVKSQYSGSEIYEKSVTELSAQNKKSLVLGFIPGYQLVDALIKLTGSNPAFSYWFAALLLAVVVRGAIWPLSQRQLMWGRQMSQLAPLMREIKEEYKSDQAQQQKKMMELYSEYGLHPLAGCWPALVQLPLFLAVYQCMLHYRFEFQKGTFLWINQATSHATHGFTAPNLGQKDTILIILYAITLLISTLLTPVNDPTQVRQQRLIGIGVSLLFPFMMLTGAYPVPCAFVLYWTFTNIFATAQSLRAYYLLPSPPLVKVNTSVGGVLPKERKKSWLERMQEQAQAQIEAKQAQTEMQVKKIRDDGENPKSPSMPSNGKPKSPSNPPSGGKQKPKRRTP